MLYDYKLISHSNPNGNYAWCLHNSNKYTLEEIFYAIVRIINAIHEDEGLFSHNKHKFFINDNIYKYDSEKKNQSKKVQQFVNTSILQCNQQYFQIVLINKKRIEFSMLFKKFTENDHVVFNPNYKIELKI